MNCQEVQNALVVYLDGEITPAERVLIQEHLSRCEDCQRQLSALAITRNTVKQALHNQAAHATPPPYAWSQLQARLAQAPRQRARRISAVPASWVHQLTGGITMYKSVGLTALAVIVTAALIIGYWPHHATPPVSAQDILDRAYAARHTTQQNQGIHHTRTETYYNYAVAGAAREVSQAPAETTSMIESYLDTQTHKFRSVITDQNTEELVSVSAYDGVYLYSSLAVEEKQPGAPFTVYRTPQTPAVMNQWGVAPGTPEVIDAERAFEAMRNNPETELLGQETWLDGRAVYVLRTPGAVIKGQPETAEGFTTMYFDVETYRLLESRRTSIQEGEEILAGYERFWVDETLPAGTPVVWDLSDLEGVVFKDDPDGTLANLILPEPLTLDELLALTPSVYVLNTIPDGFVMEISASSSEEEGLYYLIAYHDPDGHHLVLQSAVGSEKMIGMAQETYTTASGLILHLVREVAPPGSDVEYTMAFVQAPGGISFLLNSNLPQDQVKALAEDLVLASAAAP